MADHMPDSRDMSRWALVKRAATAGPLSAEHEISQKDLDEFLFDASADGDIKRVRYLLTRHPRPRIQSRPGYYSALDMASRENHVVVMQLLVNLGSAALSTTALKEATLHNNLEAITYLVGSSKDPLTYVNSLDHEKRTALYYAIRDGEQDTIRHLIQLGADAALRDAQGWNAARFACFWPNVPLTTFKFLLNSTGSSIGDQDLYGNTYLHIASRANKSEYVEWILANDADPSTTNTQQETAWEIAVEKSSFDAVGRFWYEEVEHRRRSDKYHVKNPLHQDSLVRRSRPGRPDDYEWHRIVGGSCVSRYL
ncbi:ankyrin [Hyaloscypha variabilis F]|uniref:Ankyrin n=1 Tax=Hyaloscypha variabilis (strain UAMH 11265 / GT02V1 / F) TaxID=1149755 RepID=A0A2J6S8J3_HYAVF|nr:ankyrin [Hyaloscypha variabilis F]